MLNAPCLWYRKVEDTFAIASHDLGETLQKLKDINENIEFTMEKASEGNFPFLDCIISLNENNNKNIWKTNSHRSAYPFLIKSHCM